MVLIIASILCTVATGQTSKAPADAANDTSRKVIQRGHESYYRLRMLGLDEFQSTVQPNWEDVLKNQGVTDAQQTAAALNLLNGLHFSMLLDQKGKVTVKHRTDNEPRNEQVRKGFEDIYSGINQATSGFFATWSLFMLDSPFPAVESNYNLEDLGNRYRLSYKEGSSDVVTMMGKDLEIREITVDSPEFTSIVRPQLSKTANGFMLNGYTAEYTPKASKGVVHLEVKINYAPADGMQLPASLIADGTLDGAPTHMELAFSEYQVKKH
jgi:hypothetical protein